MNKVAKKSPRELAWDAVLHEVAWPDLRSRDPEMFGTTQRIAYADRVVASLEHHYGALTTVALPDGIVGLTHALASCHGLEAMKSLQTALRKLITCVDASTSAHLKPHELFFQLNLDLQQMLDDIHQPALAG